MSAPTVTIDHLGHAVEQGRVAVAWRGTAAWFVRHADDETVTVERIQGGMVDEPDQPTPRSALPATLDALGAPADLVFKVIAAVDLRNETPASVVYFIRESLGGFIKIGVAGCAESRLKALQTSTPAELRVLAVTSPVVFVAALAVGVAL